jgi:hypothetical protein
MYWLRTYHLMTYCYVTYSLCDISLSIVSNCIIAPLLKTVVQYKVEDWHLAQLNRFRHSLHFLSVKLQVILDLQRPAHILFQVPVDGSSMGSGGGIGSCDAMLEPDTETSLSLFSCGKACRCAAIIKACRCAAIITTSLSRRSPGCHLGLTVGDGLIATLPHSPVAPAISSLAAVRVHCSAAASAAVTAYDAAAAVGLAAVVAVAVTTVEATTAA